MVIQCGVVVSGAQGVGSKWIVNRDNNEEGLLG